MVTAEAPAALPPTWLLVYLHGLLLLLLVLLLL
jgi:hypothetical protein